MQYIFRCTENKKHVLHKIFNNFLSWLYVYVLGNRCEDFFNFYGHRYRYRFMIPLKSWSLEVKQVFVKSNICEKDIHNRKFLIFIEVIHCMTITENYCFVGIFNFIDPT